MTEPATRSDLDLHFMLATATQLPVKGMLLPTGQSLRILFDAMMVRCIGASCQWMELKYPSSINVPM